MKKFRLGVSALLIALSSLLFALCVCAQTPTEQKAVCTYDDAAKTLTLRLYVSKGNAIVGYGSFKYDTSVLALADKDGNPVPAEIPAYASDGKTVYLKNIVCAKNGIIVTDVGKGTKNLVNTEKGYVLFAWYLPESADVVDASKAEVLIAEIKFLLADGKTFNDIKNDTVSLAGNDITDKIGNWYSGVVVMDSERRQYSTANGTLSVPVTYEFDFSGTDVGKEPGGEVTSGDDAGKENSEDKADNGNKPEETRTGTEAETVTDTETKTDVDVKPDKTEQPSNTADFKINCTPYENSFRIKWTSPVQNVSSYEITVCDTDGNIVKSVSGISSITESFTVKNLAGGYNFKVVVAAYTDGGKKVSSEPCAANTLPISENTALVSFTVTYDAGAGIIYGFDTDEVVFGKPAQKLPDCVAPGNLEFAGWSLDGINVIDVQTRRIYADAEYKAVYRAKSGAYMNGYDDKTFRPDGLITRAETAALAARLSGIYDGDKSYSQSFSDCDKASWYSSYVGCCVKYGIMNGYSDNTFKPSENITRAEFAAIVCRMFGFEHKGTQSFSDTEGHWASAYINALYENNAAKPYSDGTFRPDRKLTRRDAAVILNAAQKLVPDKGAIDAYVAANGNPFSDVSKSDAAYYDILAAALSLS